MSILGGFFFKLEMTILVFFLAQQLWTSVFFVRGFYKILLWPST